LFFVFCFCFCYVCLFVTQFVFCFLFCLFVLCDTVCVCVCVCVCARVCLSVEHELESDPFATDTRPSLSILDSGVLGGGDMDAFRRAARRTAQYLIALR
jgi:hypothetical protein